MCDVERTHYSAFLSSVSTELQDIRNAIHDLRKDRRVWVAERCRRDIDGIDDRKASPEELIRRNSVCLAGVRKSDALIWLLVSRDGFSRFAGDEGRVSLIEAEILQAVLDLKPIHIIRVKTENEKDFAQSVDGLLALLKKSYPLLKDSGGTFDLDDRAKLLAHVDKILKSLSPLAGLTRRIMTFRWWANIRSRVSHSGRTVEIKPVGTKSVSLEVMDAILREAESKGYDYSYRLTLLWVVKRNLQSWIDSEEIRPEVQSLLVRTLKTWQTAAAWYGIHRHFGWGRFEAINELTDQLGTNLPSVEASLHYSLARTGPLCSRGAAIRRIDNAIRQAKANKEKDRTGLLLIEAHHETRFFRPSRKRKAVRLTFKALVMRRRTDPAPGAVGEAQVDFGWRLCLCGRAQRGLSEALAGFFLLRSSDSVEPGFVVQKRRVLGMCYLANGRVGDAFRELAKAHREAIRICAFDQIRWYTILASVIIGTRSIPSL